MIHSRSKFAYALNKYQLSRKRWPACFNYSLAPPSKKSIISLTYFFRSCVPKLLKRGGGLPCTEMRFQPSTRCRFLLYSSLYPFRFYFRVRLISAKKMEKKKLKMLLFSKTRRKISFSVSKPKQLSVKNKIGC